MKIKYDPRVYRFLDKLKEQERSKVVEYALLFEEYGFSLDERYLKKVTQKVWELRPGKIRLFLCIIKGKPLAIHAIVKKSQKTTVRDLRLIEKRVKQYL